MPSALLPLNQLSSKVVDTRKEGRHTNYAIRIQPKPGAAPVTTAASGGVRGGDVELVYRRFSAFVQLQRLAQRHFRDTTFCCGSTASGDAKESCLLTPFVRPVIEATEFPVFQGGGLLGRNSKSVVSDRVVFLNAFLVALEEALNNCPARVVQRCESENCKLTKLLKSFYGCVDQPRSQRASSV
ncbi:hypothetical protein PINS_up003416 [Pythium insidiosum]|nr:hypothetical protein PINS_up003416 [Pythium insidiosum]